jgi:hypothetical protein
MAASRLACMRAWTAQPTEKLQRQPPGHENEFATSVTVGSTPKFFEHFLLVSEAIANVGDGGL